MATTTHGEATHSPRTPTALSRPVLAGIAAVGLTKLADATTTLAGIQAGYAEGNALPAAVLESVGVVPGLVALTLASVVAIVGVVEAGVLVCQRVDGMGQYVPYVRFVWYTLAAAVHCMVAGYNFALLGGWL